VGGGGWYRKGCRRVPRRQSTSDGRRIDTARAGPDEHVLRVNAYALFGLRAPVARVPRPSGGVSSSRVGGGDGHGGPRTGGG